jgi:PAS domain S-box-containing protein
MAAALLALRLMRLTGRRLAWLLVSVGLFIMAVRRMVPLALVFSGTESHPLHSTELIGLLISAVMFVGMLLIRPYFQTLRTSEDKAHRAEDRYEAVFRATGTVMAIVEEDMTLSLINDEFERVTGYSKAMVEGKMKWTEMIAPQDVERMRRFHVGRRAEAEPVPQQYEFQFITRDGEERYGQATVHMLPGTTESIASMVDITERKQAEWAIHESERRYREVVEGATELIYTTDLDGTYIYANPASLKLTGYTLRELQQQNYRQLVSPEYHSRLERYYMRLYLKREPLEMIEFPFKAKDGRVIWFGQNAHVIEEEGKVVGFRMIARDVTDRKMAERRQQVMVEGLHAVVQIADELIACPDEDTVYRRAVELARERLSLERCAIFLVDENVAHGTYGTDFEGRTTDERNNVFDTGDDWQQWLSAQIDVDHLWVKAEMSYYAWDGRKAEEKGRGWVAHTPIAQEEGKAFALFVNDAALSGADFDPALQEVVSVYCTVLANIIRRKQAETLLHLTQFSIDHTMDAVFWLGSDGRFLYVNEAACTSLGYHRDELLQMTVFDVDPDFSKELWEEHWEELKRRKGFMLESRHRAKDGRVYPVELSVNYIVFGGREYNCAFAREITERKQAELELRRSERRYRELYENLRDGSAKVDLDGRIIESNMVFRYMVGYTAEELDGLTYEDLTPAKWHKFERRVLGQQVAVRGYSEVYEKEYICKDGRLLPVELRTYLVRDADGNPAGYWATIRDISERKAAREREAELQLKLSRARRMESLGLLAGGVAHDLNNILGPIVAYPDLIIEQLPKGSPIRADVLDIQEAAKRAAAVIQDLLALARRGTYETRAVHWHEIIEQYLRSVDYRELKSRMSAIEVDTDLDSGIPMVAGSQAHLHQVLMNLVINAFEVLDAGGTVTIKTSHQVIKAPVAAYEMIDVGDYVVLEVADTGPGIKPSDLEHIFEPFFTKKKLGRSGSGLGLAVVYGIVKDLGGFVDVQSSAGKGTRFVLYLPAAEEIPELRQKTKTDFRGTETVLVVDDLDSQRELASRLLESLGYHVLEAEGGRQAVELLRARHADLVVLDMIMEEGFDGLDTYRAILEFRPSQPCVIASGFSESERVKEAQLLGAGEFVQKPYTRENIGRVVRHELDQRIS